MKNIFALVILILTLFTTAAYADSSGFIISRGKFKLTLHYRFDVDFKTNEIYSLGLTFTKLATWVWNNRNELKDIDSDLEIELGFRRLDDGGDFRIRDRTARKTIGYTEGESFEKQFHRYKDTQFSSEVIKILRKYYGRELNKIDNTPKIIVILVVTGDVSLDKLEDELYIGYFPRSCALPTAFEKVSKQCFLIAWGDNEVAKNYKPQSGEKKLILPLEPKIIENKLGDVPP